MPRLDTPYALDKPPPFVANTWPDFLSFVREAREKLRNPDVVWYRGQSRERYQLVPSLLRHEHGALKEKALFNEYERSAAYLQAKRNNDWELLIDMQHYGIPTRLMDWTDVLGIAIAFALYDTENDDEDSAIYVLDPVKLNSKSGVHEIKRVPNDPNFSYKSIYWHASPFRAVFPIAFDCALQNDRIRAQHGNFTVHGENTTPLDLQAPDAIKKIVLTSGAKGEAREFLEYANLNPFSIYPDIVGMAQHIVRKHLK